MKKVNWSYLVFLFVIVAFWVIYLWLLGFDFAKIFASSTTYLFVILTLVVGGFLLSEYIKRKIRL